MHVTHVSKDGVSYGGCEEHDLLLALREHSAIRTPFGLALIERIEREDGSGRSWNWEGNLITKGASVPVKGYYREAESRDSRDGHGHVQLAAA